MCAALTDQYTFDLGAADGTFLISPSIHLKLEFAATIKPVKRGSIAMYALVQNTMDRSV
jgi:hypothetical protein